MNLQDLFTALYIRTAHTDLPVKTAGTEDCRIQDIHTVGRCHDDDAFVVSETIHLDKHLVQRLLSLIMTAAHAGSTASGYGIDLIDKNDAGRIFLCLCKKVADTGGTHADKHFHEIRTGNTEKRNACFTGYCLG